MNNVLHIIFFVLFGFGHSDFKEIEKSIDMALRNGDAKVLSKYFTTSVKISIQREDQIANKYQAELIISEYLSENKLHNLKKSSIREKDSNNFLIFEARSQNRHVRIFMKLVKLKNSEYISEFRVE